MTVEKLMNKIPGAIKSMMLRVSEKSFPNKYTKSESGKNHTINAAMQLNKRLALASVSVMPRVNGVSPVLEIFERTIGVIPFAMIQTDSIKDEAVEYNPTIAFVPKI